MNLPIVALVGRPNVGKSTLFNCLTKTRNALVANTPGLTRDRQYGYGKVGNKPYIVIDTGGLIDNPNGIEELMQDQARIAIEEATVVLLLVDGSDGLNSADEGIANQLRQLNKPVILVLNKSDKANSMEANAEFSRLGYSETISICAAHRRGINTLAQLFCDWLPTAKVIPTAKKGEKPEKSEKQDEQIKITIIGKPNVGKSTLVNRLLKEDRLLASDMPGTTRDSIQVPCQRDGKNYLLIDTAGIRRRKNVTETVEKFSAIKAINAIAEAHIAILLIDAEEGITDQDLNLSSMVIEQGKGLVIALNKWDKLTPAERLDIKNDYQHKATFLSFARYHYISALHGQGLKPLLESANEAFASSFAKLSTSDVNNILQSVIAHHPPPPVANRRVKLRYAHIGGHNPPIIILHGNLVDKLADSYKRFLENTFRQAFNLYGTPIHLQFKKSENPYAGHKSTGRKAIAQKATGNKRSKRPLQRKTQRTR